ncbi:nicotinate-nucleotide--dimethylbenzimidazole phosphoribosyltransferase [Anderseniella sp. Alg231-50]|uniref:nicotinate-nucleotide--dimethylbenzimidazole phosphoribosyltransferase n=1 Tax=Anderseniella sp. Alg231-50 TaxID=1922226 RepID=UPI000D54D7F5
MSQASVLNSFNLPQIKPPGAQLDGQIAHAIDSKTKPPGSLGRIEVLAAQIARVQQTLTPVMDTCSLTIFAADHGIAKAGVSAFPQEVSRQMVLNFLAGGAAANVFANTQAIGVRVVDAGLAGEPLSHDKLVSRCVAPGTASFLDGPAMTNEQLAECLEHGVELGQSAAGDAVAFGEMGIANTSAAAMLAHKLSGKPVADFVGRGTGVDDAGLNRKLEILAAASARTPDNLCATDVMAEYGGFEIDMLAGAMLGAAATGRVVVVDGTIATAAAMAAVHLKPEVRDYLVFSHASGDAGHSAMIAALDVRPLLDLDLRLGEGTGALLAWPLLRCAAAMLCDMASFESAGVSGKA